MDQHYHDYGYRSQGNPSGEDGERLADRIISHVASLEGVSRLCDLGCGNGYLANRLAALGYQVVGVDASVSGIEIATRSQTSHAEFVCSTIDRSLADQLGPETFDVVVSSEVIEHLYRPADLLEAAHSLLRPGGYLVLTTPYHGYLKWLLLSLAGRMDKHLNPLWDGGHIKFFSAATLAEMVRGHGFNEIKFDYFGRMLGVWKSLIGIARKGGISGQRAIR